MRSQSLFRQRFQIRGKSESMGVRDKNGNEIYEIVASERVCSCSICLDGEWERCKYLKERGGDKDSSYKKEEQEMNSFGSISVIMDKCCINYNC